MTEKVTTVTELPKKSFIKTYVTPKNVVVSIAAVATVVAVTYFATKSSDESVDVNPTA
jgi:hypothetical protein